MTFNAAFIAHVPDADPDRDITLMETDCYRLFSVFVRDTDQAVAVCRRLVADEALDSILLCPGNSHEDVARVTAAVGENVSVSVARGDARSQRAAATAMENAGWFSARPTA
jgi:Family of unknown function (DUF6506)